MRNLSISLAKYSLSILVISLLAFSYANAVEIDASDESEYEVLEIGGADIRIDAKFDDWGLADIVLVMGEDTWEANGGSWDDEEDLYAKLRVIYDTDNLYFALEVTDDEYVAAGANPWDNDGIQMAIDGITDDFPPPGGLTADTHLYNFSIMNGWMPENGAFMGDAEIEMRRDDDTNQNLFEWRMDMGIIDGGSELKPGRKIAFAIIANDSDENSPGQAGWVGWGNNTIVWGKNPEEMQTLVLSSNSVAVDMKDKLATTWGALK